MGRDSIRFINGVIMRKRVGILVKGHIIVREGALDRGCLLCRKICVG